ncbi:S41 family peptidase [Sphingomicrobium aestuariivivum]|uniref:S41 family peptidase n=1 Tax=Sphingomicrobium aestuariivivum TaxID=1582356 RepID=UPI001FD6585F|nr:S41 family peptidase [Sphingomicrobium aestuariivivum]MCJ8190615.1 S41 family peptidase [Sphingomicrobium aestuariivivum]
MIALALLLAAAMPVTPADRAEVIANSASILEERYVDAQEGARLAAALRAGPADLAAHDDAEAFAAAMTAWLRAASGDGHLGLSFSQTPIPETPADDTFAGEMEQWYGPQINHGFERIVRHEGNIIELRLDTFAPPDMAADMFIAAATLTAEASALILDLRRNGGGSSEAAEMLLYYLTEPGSPLSGTYHRPTDSRRHAQTASYLPGRRFGSDKPLYVLISKRTFSAAEQVAYDLQALGRATIIGEVSGGGAHPFEFRRVHPHFALDLPEGKSINPITGGNWQGVGVTPDVAVPASEALDTALGLAREATGAAD